MTVVVATPFEKQVVAGQLIRMRPVSGQHVRISFSNTTAASCAVTGIGFKKGRPVGDVSGNTFNFAPGQEAALTFEKTPQEADDLIVYVKSGAVTLKAELIAASGAGSPRANPGNAGNDLPAEVTGPASVDMASRFEVTWSGPGAKDDYITIARPGDAPRRNVGLVRIREGNPVKMWAPSEPGAFELRYVLARGTKVLARTPITINAVTATQAVAGPVKASGWIRVTWTGPSGEGDAIGVARSQVPAILERAATKQGNPAQVRAPGMPGIYELRYILGRGGKVLTTAPVTIEEVTATVSAATAAKVGTDVEVTWTGPGYADDSIVLARPGQLPGASVVAKAMRSGSPLKLRAPTEPGDYEVRYLLGHGKRTLAASPIQISANP